MDTLPLVTQMFGLIAFGALIWLTIRAFKMNPGWGIAVLLLSPFGATAFGVKHWNEEREPFLLYITTFLATLALCVYLFTTFGGLEPLGLSASLQRGMQIQNLAGTSRDHFMRTRASDGEIPLSIDKSATGKSTSPADVDIPAEERATSEDKPVIEKNKPVRYRLTYLPIKLSEANNYIGSTAKVRRRNAREKEYLITGTSPRHIELAHRSKGGQFSFRFKNSDIENIRVLVKEAY